MLTLVHSTLGLVDRARLDRLRYFRHTAPMGGFGGDWDTLAAVIACADDAALASTMTSFGRAVPTESGSLGMVEIVGDSVGVRVQRSPGGGGTVELTLGAYIGPNEIAHAERIEAWLDAEGLRATPRAR